MCSSDLPATIPEESFILENFPAPASALNNLPSDPVTLNESGDLRFGDTNTKVAAIQIALQKLGYFDHDITSYFGEVTRDALRLFMRDSRMDHYQTLPEVTEEGTETSVSPGEIADKTTRDLLVSHHVLLDEIGTPLEDADTLLQGTSGKSVRVLQRLLRMLDLYYGEIDGIYDQELMTIVYQFQKDMGIVQSLSDTGAGIVGPQTQRALLTAWRDVRIQKRGGSTVVAAL